MAGADAAKDDAQNKESHRQRGCRSTKSTRGHAHDVHHPHDEDGARVATHGHEAGVAKRQLAEVAGRDVERDGQDDVDADLLDDARLVAAHHAAIDHELAHDEKDHDEKGVDQIAHGHGEAAIAGGEPACLPAQLLPWMQSRLPP
jgi:hypothetical protein